MQQDRTDMHHSPTSDGSTDPSEPSPVPDSGVDLSAKQFKADVKCPECSEPFRDSASLQKHILKSHYGMENTENGRSCNVCGVFVHGGEEQIRAHDETHAVSGLLGLKPDGQINGQTDGQERTPSRQDPTSVSPNANGKVFNAEAYCELCNKEFCNKYFLRTHKANKHGVQTNTTPGKGGPGRPKNKTPPACTISSMEGSAPPLWSTAPGGLPTMVPPKTEPPPPTPEPFRPTPEVNFLHQLQLQDHNHMAPVMPKPQMPEAFCPVCQQHFPNTFVLQSHFLAAHNPLTTAPSYTMSDPMSFLFRSMAGPPGFPPTLNTLMPPISTAPLDFSRPMPDLSPVNMVNPMQPVKPSVLTPQPPPPKQDSFCDICQKEFCNKYFLRTHKLNKHGIAIPETPTSGKRSSSDGERTGDHSPQEMPLRANVDELRAGDEPAAKRVKKDLNGDLEAVSRPDRPFDCGICGERLKTGYDLAFHKYQYHGDPKPDQPLDMPPAPPATPGEGVPSGADPEAYCEFCQKEFCSKYFLKTHKLNIHGINLDGPSQVLPFPQGLLPMPGLHHLPVPVTTQMSMTPLPQMQIPQTITPGIQKVEKPIPAKTKLTSLTLNASSGKNFCDICNKELCNKYFLRTHMAKMHGLRIDENKTIIGPADQTPARGSYPCDICGKELSSKHFLKMHRSNTHGVNEDRRQAPPTMVPVTLPPGLPPLLDPTFLMNSMSNLMPQMPPTLDPIVTRPQEPKQEPVWEPTGGSPSPHSDGSDPSSHNTAPKPTSLIPSDLTAKSQEEPYKEICGVCDRRFKSIKWLRTHMWTEHHRDVLTSTLEEQPQNLSCKGSPQKHEAETLPNGTKMYKCAYCPYSTRWLSNLCVHEKRHTGGTKSPAGALPKTYTCTICLRSYRYQHSLQRHMTCHKFVSNLPPALAQRYGGAGPLIDQNGMASPTKTKGIMEGQTPIKCSPCSRRFRCTSCQKVFKSRDVARMHYRAVHRREQLAVPNPSPRKTYRCKLCGHATRIYDELRQHLIDEHKITPKSKSESSPQKQPGPLDLPAPAVNGPLTPPQTELSPPPGNYIMQPFVMKETTQSGAFVSSMVYLPVCREVKGPIDASFTFIPLPANVPLPYPFA